MRKFSLVLAVLLFTAPVWATVTITVSPTANPNTFLISYVVSVDEPNKVRAFAMDIKVDEGAVITDVNDSVSAYYDIYPGSIVITDGAISDLGTADANRADWEEGSPQYQNTGPGIDSNWVTVEMGALYYPTNDSSPNAPPLADNLLKVTVSGATPGCMLCITENDIRGGVVMTDPSLNPAVIAPCYSVVAETVSKPGTPTAGTVCGNKGKVLVNQAETFTTTGSVSNYGHTIEYQFDWGDGTQSAWSISMSAGKTWAAAATRNVTVTARCQTHTTITNTSDAKQEQVMPDCFPAYTTRPDWLTMCYPQCWCAAPNGSGYQCLGDADGTVSVPKKYRIFTDDFTILSNNWKKLIADPALDPCADFDHKGSVPKKYRVFTDDFTLLSNNWKRTDAGIGIPGPCPPVE